MTTFRLADQGRILGIPDWNAELPVAFTSTITGLNTAVIHLQLDSGAAICVAPSNLATELGLNLRAGSPLQLDGVGGGIRAYVHSLRLHIGGEYYDNVPVAITTSSDTPFLLGRLGFWQQTSVSIDNIGRTVALVRTGNPPPPPLDIGTQPPSGFAPPPNANFAMGLLAVFAIGVGAYVILGR